MIGYLKELMLHMVVFEQALMEHMEKLHNSEYVVAQTG